MPDIAKPRLTTDDFLAWTQGQPGRWELHHGEALAMSPERLGHADVKFAVQTALKAAIRQAGVPCRMVPDGVTVRIDEGNAYEPDALVYCGGRALRDAVEITNPVIVVEVLSPGTRRYDTGAKFAGYISLPGIRHYLIVDAARVDAARKLVVHHRRADDGAIGSSILREGILNLDPPGIAVNIAALFEDD